ncbi:MAG: roadblock/LC7 domain-containing protein [Verrucomicrobia bacterium]|nr:roadblock/LC7 domain-containing protein [Verrucomicrobiota bacterium]
MPAPTPAPDGYDVIELALKPIVQQMPELLGATLKRPFFNEDRICIPLKVVLPQLSQGRVNITFGELKRFAPQDLFPASHELDSIRINVPLQEIIPKLGVGQLPRRNGQKRVEVAEEAAPLFVRMSASSPIARQVPGPGELLSSESRGLNENGPIRPERHPEAGDRVPANGPFVPTVPLINSTVSAGGTGQEFECDNHLAIPLAMIAGSWPEAARRELVPADLSEAVLLLPMDELERTLKRGKALFEWNHLRSCIRPPLRSQRSTAGEFTVELPLDVVAPQFLARRKPAQQRKLGLVVSEAIPHLFGSRPASREPEMDAALPNRLSENSTLGDSRGDEAHFPKSEIRNPKSEIDKDLHSQTGSRTPEGSSAPDAHLGHLFGEPSKRRWTVAEIVQRTARLRGVGGALLATLDGLLIAAELPPEQAAETLAAFVPHMFVRMAQYSKELQFGEPRHLTVYLEETPLQIHKAGCVYLTLLGRVGEPLPTAQLSAIAAALPRPAVAAP